MCFMQTESVLQTENRSGPAKIWFSVALVSILCKQSIRLFQQTLWYKLIFPHMHHLFINKMG